MFGAEMGKGEPMNKICVEKPKVHGSDFRSMARQRRLVCVALFVALLPFAITRSYLFYTNSDVPFFQAQPAPAGVWPLLLPPLLPLLFKSLLHLSLNLLAHFTERF